MSEIKLSPLLLFLLMLIVLVVATTVKNWGIVSEGFISYLQNADSFSKQTVKGYDNTSAIYKLYDDIFYDNRNGNVVFVSGTTFVSDADTTGSSVTQIDVVPRTLTKNVVYKKGDSTMSQQCDESKSRTISNVETAWFAKNSVNQLFYITWGTDTYLYVADLTGTLGNTTTGNTSSSGLTYKPVCYSYFNDSSKQLSGMITTPSSIRLKSAYGYATDGKDDTNIVVDFYDKVKTVFQLLSNVFYDVKNGNLLTKTAGTSGKLNVYTRGSTSSSYEYGSPLTSSNSTPASQITFSQSSVSPYFIQDPNNDHTIMYWPNGDNTLIVTFKNVLISDSTANRGNVDVKKVYKFTREGLYSPNPNDNKGGKDLNLNLDLNGNTDTDSDVLDAFARWYIYFNTSATGITDDYLLKTQIVPPVCPACPGCSTSGVCTDCGGTGGSGTKSSDSSSLAFDKKTVVGATGSAVTNAVDATGNVLNKTVDTAGNVVNKTVDTAGNVVNKTFDTATNVVGKTFDAAGNLLSSTASAIGLDRVGYQQSYRGPVNNSNTNAIGYPSSGYKNAEYRAGSNNTGVPNYPNANPNDPYSYNGALQSKGGNFIPLTADFSRFGR
jgi:hypothetical protein